MIANEDKFVKNGDETVRVVDRKKKKVYCK